MPEAADRAARADDNPFVLYTTIEKSGTNTSGEGLTPSIVFRLFVYRPLTDKEGPLVLNVD
ncbi:MAG: hypothetical protein U0936_03440 [Planctomycetaceae bacterium]